MDLIKHRMCINEVAHKRAIDRQLSDFKKPYFNIEYVQKCTATYWNELQQYTAFQSNPMVLVKLYWESCTVIPNDSVITVI